MSADSQRAQLLQISASMREYLETLRESGVSGLPQTATKKPLENVESAPVSSSAQSAPLSPLLTQAATSPSATQVGDLFLSPKVHTAQTLEELRAEIGDCRRCKLCQGRTNIVFGVGDAKAELVFVGEGPGRDEDLKGEPFVGRAGQLLTEIITKGMKMRRDEVYICNVVKCRPPDNRNPEPDEIAACEPFLIRQLEIVKPRIIVALGAFAAQTLLKTKTPISRLRGNWHSYRDIKLMPTLHPAYLLRNPADKKLVWQDIQAVLREMGRL
ncbi:MAG: uracil-DNA glycosylase [Deltaproteobacteria bacterium]|nr:uracil-DNA glycosylase [Deltaproteobacteria bacterium]